MSVLVDYVKHLYNTWVLLRCGFFFPLLRACTRFIKIGLGYAYISIFELELNNRLCSFMIFLFFLHKLDDNFL